VANPVAEPAAFSSHALTDARKFPVAASLVAGTAGMFGNPLDVSEIS
jgi:hypothetical protein